MPLPPHISSERVILALNPGKDVDGLHPTNLGLLLSGTPEFVPCTPAGVQQILLRTGNSPNGKHVVICGRSNLVGKPLAALLSQKAPDANATVTVCHTGTRDLAEHTRRADILVAAAGSPLFITGDMVREGTVVIDVGINRIDDPSSRQGSRLVGDVDFDAVVEKASAITPVPGGVGPLTVAMLLANTVKAAERGIAAATIDR
jgi:methylenetetrahydrofolate dehydrogenase (NADP+)/methenyltetrahydrofolate cyclohydrolase